MASLIEKHKIDNDSQKLIAPQAGPRKYVVVYRNLITFTYWHLAALYGLYLGFTTAKWATVGFAIILYMAAQIGVTAGAHRLWSHRSYKAKLPLQIILMIFHSLSFQNTVQDWVRDHRLHHKFSDTDADPHNAARGFFFSHIGWVLVRKHPEVIERGKSLNLADIQNNPVLRFQKKYAVPVIGLIGFVLPTVIPIYFWDETLSCAWHLAICRFIANLNATFLVNSAAHKFGYKPYDKTIFPAQNIPVSVFTLGEGFHNYHHVYPWDYRTAELGNNRLNMTTLFIDFFSWIGWAYDLKTAPPDAPEKKAGKSGDGTDLWGHLRNTLTGASNLTEQILRPIDNKNHIIARQKYLRIYGEEVKLGEFKHHVFIYKSVKQNKYRAFCGGSIIAPTRVLSSSNCFLTTRKRYKLPVSEIRVVGGILATVANETTSRPEQWRQVEKIYSQRFYKFPAYNLAILKTKNAFDFNSYVNKIPYAIKALDYDGVCVSTVVKSASSWSEKKVLFSEQLQMVTRDTCEADLLRSCKLYYCTAYKARYIFSEVEGAGLLCRETGDPKETDTSLGVLVGVTSLINVQLPTLHHKVYPFYEWVTDNSRALVLDKLVVLMCLFMLVMN